MRTTITLDDDVATKVQAEMRRTGRSMKEVVNEHLRVSFLIAEKPQPRKRFRVEPVDMGDLRPGLSLDCIGTLLDEIEGPHR